MVPLPLQATMRQTSNRWKQLFLRSLTHSSLCFLCMVLPVYVNKSNGIAWRKFVWVFSLSGTSPHWQHLARTITAQLSGSSWCAALRTQFMCNQREPWRAGTGTGSVS